MCFQVPNHGRDSQTKTAEGLLLVRTGRLRLQSPQVPQRDEAFAEDDHFRLPQRPREATRPKDRADQGGPGREVADHFELRVAFVGRLSVRH